MRLIFVRRSISAKVLRSTAGTIKTCVTPYPASISARHWAPVIFAIVAPYLLDGERIGGRSHRARDRDRRRDEQELVHLVCSAVFGEFLHVEDLAHGHAHHRDRDPVPGLVDSWLGLVRPHLAAPVLGSERRELRALDPLEGLEREARRVSARIAVPAPGLELGLH